MTPETADSYSASATQVTCQDGNDERGTPVDLVRTLWQANGGKFDLDPCSGAEPTPIADHRYTKSDNGLAQPWFGSVYMNPPYSDLKSWLKKAIAEYNRDDPNSPNLIIGLLPGNFSTKWFQDYAARADYFIAIEGRLQFEGTDHDAPFAAILVVFGDPDEECMATLASLGKVYERTDIDALETTEQTFLELQGERSGSIEGSVAGDGIDASCLDGLLPRDTLLLEFDPGVSSNLGNKPDPPLAPATAVKVQAYEYKTADGETVDAPCLDHYVSGADAPADYVDIATINPQNDRWYRLQVPLDDPSAITCEVAIDGWTERPLRNIRLGAPFTGPTRDAKTPVPSPTTVEAISFDGPKKTNLAVQTALPTS